MIAARPRRFLLRVALGVAAAAAFVSAPGSAQADTPPSRWDRARDPEIGKTYRLHVEVQRRLAQDAALNNVMQFPPFSPALESQKDRVRVMLEREAVEKSHDVRLRFDLGWLYLMLGSTSGEHYYGKAAQVLKSALADAPDHPAAEDAWLRLAFACGHIGEHDCERRSYLQVLRRETEDFQRVTPSLNLAETEMHLGNLKEAIEGYRETLRLATRVERARESAPLAVWGLAVALDRSGDSVAGEKEARFALELERSMGRNRPLLHSPDVFFVPAYEVTWYDGLGATAQAKVATTPKERFLYWKAAEKAFEQYVLHGESARDRWIELAKLRLANARAERIKAEKKVPKEPAKLPGQEDEETTL